MNPLLMPVVLVQGMRARANTPMLPPANGPTSGAVGSEAGLPLRLAGLGELTAAGCGVTTYKEGFAVIIGGMTSRAARVTVAAAGR